MGSDATVWRNEGSSLGLEEDQAEFPVSASSRVAKGFADQDEGDQSWLYKLEHRLPHLYYVTTDLILPLLTLIGMAFLFGGILASIEMKEEIRRNDKATAKIFVKYAEHVAERHSFYYAMANTSLRCLADTVGNDSLVEVFQPTDDISTCASERAKDMFPATSVLPYMVGSEAPLTFNWMNCWKKNTIGDENATLALLQQLGLNKHLGKHQQLLRYLHRFYTEWDGLKNETGLPDERIFANKQLVADLLDQTTGSDGCEVHLAGGALFWFTVMTTVGYGNTVPTSDEGRLLVCTAGFLTIVLFIALNNTAAQVWKEMFEHFFIKFNLRSLVRGPLSVVFWLCLTFLWMLVMALIIMSLQKKHLGGFSMPLKDLYWFSFATITTVGFGDMHIKHEEFTAKGMFHIPVVVLIGFNFLGIFAEKAVGLYYERFPKKRGYGDILRAQRTAASQER